MEEKGIELTPAIESLLEKLDAGMRSDGVVINAGEALIFWDLLAVNMSLRAALSGWKPIATAPRDGTKVLLSTKWGVLQGHWHQPGNVKFEGWWDCFGHTTKSPNGWMPLPPPPKDETP